MLNVFVYYCPCFLNWLVFINFCALMWCCGVCVRTFLSIIHFWKTYLSHIPMDVFPPMTMGYFYNRWWRPLPDSTSTSCWRNTICRYSKPHRRRNLTSDKIELLCFYRGGYESIQEGHSEGAYLCQAPDSAIRLYGNLASHSLYVWREF